MWVRDDGNIELLLDLYAQFRKPKRKRIILSIGILMKRVSLDPCGSKSGGVVAGGNPVACEILRISPLPSLLTASTMPSTL